MSFSAHKTYGPKGIGALYVSRKPRVRIEATMHGGGHERGMRSGTLATHQIVGMGEAFRVAKEDMAAENIRIKALSDRFYKQVENLEELYINGSMTARVPHNLNCWWSACRKPCPWLAWPSCCRCSAALAWPTSPRISAGNR